MGNSGRVHHAGAVAALVLAASAAAQSPIEIQGLTADQVMTNIVTRCAADKGAVEQATPNMVVCSVQGNFGDMLLFGSRGGSMPVYRHRFVIVPGAGFVSIFPSGSVDSTNGFGATRSTPLNMRPKDLARIRETASGQFANAPFPAPPAEAPQLVR